jgi:hypothetical protein
VAEGGVAYGPGPEGDLPSGYCCTSDLDCRNRSCVDLSGGNRMCEDECDGSQSLCDGAGNLAGFTCTPDDSGVYGFCEPPSPTTPCVPAGSYQHGTKADGACCASAQECLGGLCESFYDSNPFICTRTCDSMHACPIMTSCLPSAGEYYFCVPDAMIYTCQ